MRTLIVTFDPPHNVGGVEGRAVGYVRQLLKTHNFVEIASFSPNSKPSVGSFLGAKIHRFPSNISFLPSTLASVVSILRSERIDTVFFLSGGVTVYGNLLLLYCRLLGIRTAIFLYGKDILQARKSSLRQLLLELAQLLTNKVVVNSRFTSTLLRRNQSAAVLYPSVDVGAWDSTAQGLASRDKVLFVGRLVERKGLEDLLHAMTLLQHEVPGVRLEVVGDGPQRAKLERMSANLGISGMVTFFGELRGKELYGRYEMCAVFAMPSRTMKDDVEGFGTVFLEAGLFGKPSVGTMSGGIPEAVLDGVTGILVGEGDIAGLAAALKTLLLDRELSKKLGGNARRRVVHEFTWEKGTSELVKILGEREE